MTPQEFVAKWRNVTQKERSTSQSHFNDLCALVGQRNPIEDDPTGERFAFEKGADKQSGGQGWADVWKRDYFAWEYKGKHANLKKAYDQLLLYRESLMNPPLLVVSDLDSIVVHTNFTNTVKRMVTITLDDLLTPDGMRNLRAIFTNFEHFRVPQTTEQVTRQAATEFALLADNLRKRYESPELIAHYLIRVLFCLFSEDIELLPKGLFAGLVDYGRRNPATFTTAVSTLFQTMATGGLFGRDPIRYFDGGLFDGGDALALDPDGLNILHRVAQLDWSSIEPSIFGTLFQRSLDPSKRSQLGAQYTSKEDILLIVEPVLMAPLRREWEAVKVEAAELTNKRDTATAQTLSVQQGLRTRYHNELRQLIERFVDRLAKIRILDPACGSGNFLYVALRLLLDLWQEVRNFAGTVGLTPPAPLPTTSPSPLQLFGIEVDAYAHELAQATVWIGYIQWLNENGHGIPAEPILRKLDNIKHMDAILGYDADGKPVEPEWPVVDVVVGNPPFLGGQKLRRKLGDSYVDTLFKLYHSRVPGAADLVCYWFERSREMIVNDRLSRAGLLTTQTIRAGKSREVLERIKKSGDIFMAWSDRPWILDGADLRVSIIGFDNGAQITKFLDGKPVNQINANLNTELDVSVAERLSQNSGIGFEGIKKNGPFELTDKQARGMLSVLGNPNGRPNSDVVKRWINGKDITDRPAPTWLVDFGVGTKLEDAAQYDLPFAYMKQRWLDKQKGQPDIEIREQWWLFERPRPAMQSALKPLPRFIVTTRVAKYRIFAWIEAGIVPDGRLNVFARSDDYFFGILHSKTHEAWALANAALHGDGTEGGRPTYNNRTCFETFPFPWPPGQEPADSPIVQAIAQAAKELVEKRDNWLNPAGASADQLKKLTLTNLYNARPTWLDLAHHQLDAAVLTAYGWSDLMNSEGITDEETLLARLLALNLERAAKQGEVQPARIEEGDDD